MSEISRSTRSLLEHVDRGAPALREQHFVPFAPQHDRQQFPHRSLIVDDEDAGRTALRGRRLLDGRFDLFHDGHFGPRRKTDGYGRARAGMRADLNLSVVVGHDAMDDRQPEACALGEAAVKRLKEPVELLGRNADPFVLHGDHAHPRQRFNRRDQPQPSAVGHRAQAVRRQVPDNLFDLSFVRFVPELASADRSTSTACPSQSSELLRRSSAVSFSARRTSNRAIAKRCGRRTRETNGSWC